MPYDPTSNRGKVRLLANDVDDNNPVFTDEEIDAFLALTDGAVLLAAATAIETIADNEALSSKVIKTQDLSTDGAKVADALRARAKTLREQYAAEAEGDGFFEVVEYDPLGHVELAEG